MAVPPRAHDLSVVRVHEPVTAGDRDHRPARIVQHRTLAQEMVWLCLDHKTVVLV